MGEGRKRKNSKGRRKNSPRESPFEGSFCCGMVYAGR